MAEGGCNCGAVTFEVACPIDDVYVCHCSICRRSTGSNGIAVVIVPNDHFRWRSGEELIATWKKPGHDYQLWFCQTCGSPLPGVNSDDTMFIPAGLITQGGDQLRVAHHIWVGSKAAWDEIGDAGRLHQDAYEQ